MDDGRLTDSQGREVDFRNTIIIMTSNIGSSYINKSKRTLGFVGDNNEEKEFEKIKDLVLEEVKRTFRPEFLNRIDETIIFHPLNKEHIEQIIDILLRDLRKRLSEKNMKLILTKSAKEFLVEKGFDPVYGARPLKRAIQRYVEDPLSEEILRGKFNEGDTIVCRARKDALRFTRKGEKKEKVVQ
jgi:ATP-dependent Clp protease ATP-binding subunit ClpC